MWSQPIRAFFASRCWHLVTQYAVDTPGKCLFKKLMKLRWQPVINGFLQTRKNVGKLDVLFFFRTSQNTYSPLVSVSTLPANYISWTKKLNTRSKDSLSDKENPIVTQMLFSTSVAYKHRPLSIVWSFYTASDTWSDCTYPVTLPRFDIILYISIFNTNFRS